jgi:hypothetical protein
MGPGGGRVPFPDDDDESENENEDEDYDVKLKRLGLRFETEMVGCMFPEYWRSGFGTEAALAALEWAFRSGIYGDVIHAFADPRNVGSVGVLLKLGMRQLADPTKPHPSLTKAPEGSESKGAVDEVGVVYVKGEVDRSKTVRYLNENVLKLAVTARQFLSEVSSHASQ